MAKSSRVPWKRSSPRKRAGKASTHLTATEKAAAKRSAKRAGRPYPNLVDNMRVAAKKARKTKTSGRKRAAGSASGQSGASKRSKVRKAAVPKRKTAAARKRKPTQGRR